MELKYCKECNQMTNHELNSIAYWYCLKCKSNKLSRNKRMAQYRLITYYKGSNRIDVGMSSTDSQLRLIKLGKKIVRNEPNCYCEVVEVKERLE
jgi:hypothetical protein